MIVKQKNRDELIDLGAVGVETKGTPQGVPDTRGGLIPHSGLNNE